MRKSFLAIMIINSLVSPVLDFVDAVQKLPESIAEVSSKVNKQILEF